MAAMKPRTGSGPMEAVEESRKIVMRIPSDGGGRLVVEPVSYTHLTLPTKRIV